MVAPPMPASCIASRSRVMPSLLRFEPIHIHSTWGRAAAGGLRKTAARSYAPEAESGDAEKSAGFLKAKGMPASHVQNCRRVGTRVGWNIMEAPVRVVHDESLTGILPAHNRSGKSERRTAPLRSGRKGNDSRENRPAFSRSRNPFHVKLLLVTFREQGSGINYLLLFILRPSLFVGERAECAQSL